MADIDQEFKDSLRGALGKDFMQEIIFRWIDSASSTNKNFKGILQILEDIDRYDIYDDCLASFQTDAEIFRDKQLQIVRSDNKVINIITSDDRQRARSGLKLFIYDAFLLFAENEEDTNFAKLVYDKLTKEKQLRICSKDHLIIGLEFEYHAYMELISKRCRRVIVIESNAFMGSKAEQFLIKYAQDTDIRQNTRKIVPIQREEVKLTGNLQILFHLKYYRQGFSNFWDKLYETIEYSAELEESLESDEYEYIPPKLNSVSDSQAIAENSFVLPESVSSLALPAVIDKFNSSTKNSNNNLIQQLNNTRLVEADQLSLLEDAPSPPSNDLTEHSLEATVDYSTSTSVTKEKKGSYKKLLKNLKKLKKKLQNNSKNSAEMQLN